MKTKRVLACIPCNIEFTVSHEADESFFQVSFCPFCGEHIDIDCHYEFDDDEE